MISAPFYGLDPLGILDRLVALVQKASETYPYTSLYAFNAWSVALDFWQPDDAYVAIGAAALVAGLLASCLPLWRRRDLGGLLAAATFAAFAFYYLPTRAHERYLFPAFVLLLPFAAARTRILMPYLVLAVSFAVSLTTQTFPRRVRHATWNGTRKGRPSLHGGPPLGVVGPDPMPASAPDQKSMPPPIRPPPPGRVRRAPSDLVPPRRA